MSIFNQFPWTNFREYNLDWVIRTVQDCKDTVDAALADVSNAVAMYFADHIDTTLSVSGDAADAAVVGTRITTANNNITNLQGRMTTVEGYGPRITALESEAACLYSFEMTKSDNTLPYYDGIQIENGQTVADLVSDISDGKNVVIYISTFNSYATEIRVSGSTIVNFIIPYNHYRCYITSGSNTGTAKYLEVDISVSTLNYFSGDYSRLVQAMTEQNYSATYIKLRLTGGPLATPIYFSRTTGNPEYITISYVDGTTIKQIRCNEDGTIVAL